MKECYDFGGWVIKYEHSNINGRTYRKGFLKNDSKTLVPLCWNHQHNYPDSILGNVLLDNSDDGVYVYGRLYDNKKGGLAKELIEGKSVFLSPYINRVRYEGKEIVGGNIKEVSLVLDRIDPDECYIPIWNTELEVSE